MSNVRLVFIGMGVLIIVLAFFALLGAVGSKALPTGYPTDNRAIGFWHDEERHVGCWIYRSGYQGGLACLPDGQYTP